MKKTKIYSMIIALGLSIFMISGCGGASKTSSQESDSHEHVHTLSGYQHDETDHWQVCSECGEIVGKEHHTGGTSSCTHKAICSVCGAEYGELDEHSYGPVKYKDGESYHYQECSLCGDIKKENHTFDRKVVDNKYLVGEYQSACGATNKYYLSCKCGEHSHDEALTFEVTSEHSFTVEEVLAGDANLISPASCTEAAVYGKVCEHCHEMFSTEETFTHGEPLGHHYGDLIEESMTFYSYHIDYYHCDRCDKYFIDVREPGASEPVYQESSIEEIFDDSKSQYLDTEAGYGTEEKPYVISSPEELKMFAFAVNGDKTNFEHAHEGGDTFENKFVVLGNDINLDSEHDFGLSIANKDSTPFSGTFDGKNYTISNYLHHGSDAVGLFSRVTNGTIKNLKLANVDVETTTQRSAGVVARAENATLDNVHVLSGNIVGAKQNAGLIAVVLGGATLNNCSNNANITGSDTGNAGIVGFVNDTGITITNCVNTGNVTATSAEVKKYNGGILGYIANGSVNITGCSNSGTITSQSEATGGIVGYLAGTSNKVIAECTNTGAINGKGNGTGGILGANAEFTTPTVNITDCVNKGSVAGASYVGGIVGIARGKNSNGSKGSAISGCSNYGDISATGVSAGGIAGCARYSVTNCKTYYLAKITLKEVTKTAVELAVYGEQLEGTGGGTNIGIGYLVGTQGMSVITTVTGKLINADGSDYSA